MENIEIKKIAAEGKSIAYVEDKVLFVPNTVPGDIVDVQVTRKRKSFLEGLVTRMHHPSELRIKLWRMQMAKPALRGTIAVQTTGSH